MVLQFSGLQRPMWILAAGTNLSIELLAEGRVRGITALLATLLVCAMAAPAVAEKKIALVIGNNAYKTQPLNSPGPDAQLIAAKLQKIDFKLVGDGPQINLDKASTDRRLTEFASQAQDADIALFYFSGHGVQVDGENYLIPTDVDALSPANIDFQTLAAARVLAAMDRSNARLKIMLLDASRRNSFTRHKGADAGLAIMRAPQGTVIGFATQPNHPNTTAADGPPGSNSPYAKALETYLGVRGLSLFTMLNDVGLAVMDATNNAQQPWISASPISGGEPALYPGPAPTIEAAARERLENLKPSPPPALPQSSRSIDRYPTIEAPERTAVGRKTTVLVSLTVHQETPSVAIDSTGPALVRTTSGGLAIPAEDRNRVVTVILNVAGFDFDPKTPQRSDIELDWTGDSTVARFDITATPGAVGTRSLRVTFWRDGEFLASASRKIEVEAAMHPARTALPEPKSRRPDDSEIADKAKPQDISADEPVSITSAKKRRPIDLTVEVVYDDPRTFSRGSVTIDSPYLTRPQQSKFKASTELSEWIEAFYRDFRNRGDVSKVPQADERGARAADTNDAHAGAQREQQLGRLRAFGEELYRRAAPEGLKKVLESLLADKTVKLRTVQIYSNNPLIPWELMRAPLRQGGSTDFFGIAFALARWHEDDDRIVVRPLQDQVEEVIAVAPRYGDPHALPATSPELENIRSLLSGREVAGRLAEFRSLVQNLPNGIVHFAGHGEVLGRSSVERQFIIRFEDGTFDVMDWRGLSVRRGNSRALFFFNACDVGQAESAAGAVEGWGPAALAKGASGYIGGLWPLKDDPASRFAVAFYSAISRMLQHGDASVAEALAEARRLVYSTGDATFLAYAFYGDAELALVRKNGNGTSQPIPPGEIVQSIQRAHKQLDKDDYAGARATLTQGITANSSFAPAFSYRGFAWYLEGRAMRAPKEALTRYHKALQDLDGAVKLDPTYLPVRRHRGNTRVAEYWALQALREPTNGIVEQALDDFKEAARLDPTSKISANALGRAYLLQRSYDSAIESFKKAIDRDQKYAAAYSGLCFAYRMRGDMANARKNAQLAAKYDNELDSKPCLTDGPPAFLAPPITAEPLRSANQ
jgi:tetratricopeptide (TPR) repeat protein